MKPVFFRTSAELRNWFERHHASEKQLLVGFHKKGSGKPSVSWPESVDEALCVGWIDGIRGSLDEQSYSIRFTPRKPRSVWSAVNVARARELDRKGRMKLAGRRVLEARRENRSGIYSYEQRRDRLEEPYASLAKKNGAAWDFFQRQPPSYRKAASWWVVSAKKEEMRWKRLDQLLAHSAAGRRIPQFTRSAPRAPKKTRT